MRQAQLSEDTVSPKVVETFGKKQGILQRFLVGWGCLGIGEKDATGVEMRNSSENPRVVLPPAMQSQSNPTVSKVCVPFSPGSRPVQFQCTRNSANSSLCI